MGKVKHSHSSQNSIFAMSLQYLLKEVRDEVDFLGSDKHQSFLQVDFSTLGIKHFLQGDRHNHENVKGMVMGMIKHSKMLNVTSLQWLYNISKKKLRIEFIFEFIKIDYQFLMKVARHVQSTQKRKSVKFLQYIKKSIPTAFMFYCDAKDSDTLQRSSHVCCYLFLAGCGQKWVWPFRSWNSKICCISREWIDEMSWLFCLLVDRNLGKLMLI